MLIKHVSVAVAGNKIRDRINFLLIKAEMWHLFFKETLFTCMHMTIFYIGNPYNIVCLLNIPTQPKLLGHSSTYSTR